MIDPPANAIISGNDCTDDLFTLLRNPEEIGLNRSLSVNEMDWLVPRGINWEDCRPERYYSVVVRLLVSPNENLPGIHNEILP
jgi:hypothetical protein